MREMTNKMPLIELTPDELETVREALLYMKNSERDIRLLHTWQETILIMARIDAARTALESPAAEPVALDMPDVPGWWAFEGRWRSQETDATWRHVFETEIKDNILYVVASLDYELPSMFVGKWTRLTLPWQDTAARGQGEER